MKIEYNKETNTITIGKYVVSKYKHLTFKDWLYEVLIENDCHAKVYPRKEYYKTATEVLQCTPSVMYKIFRKLQYKAYVVPYLEYVNKIGFRKNGVDYYTLEKIVKNKALLDQAKEDNLWNLIPFICQFSKSPAELKVMFGKHWKKIVNNSLNKNKYLALLGARAGAYCNVPTTLLKQQSLCRHNSLELMQYLTMHYKGKWSIISNDYKVLHLFCDTQLLADSLGKEVNPKWSPRRLKEEHDKFSKEVNAKKYSKGVFESLATIKVKSLVYKSGVSAVLLDNAFDIAEEGTCMNHCVGGYSGEVAKGNYLVYSIRDKDGLRISTLGIHIVKGSMEDKGSDQSRYVFSQHYGKYNSPVTDLEQIAIVESLLIQLNKE